MNLPTVSLTQDKLSNFEPSIQKEWLITNGLGGYASSTVLGINTRKYHGLLVAALHPPGDRTVCLEKLDEEVNIGKELYLLGANEFIGAVFPKGFVHLKEFSVSPFPKYVYSLNEVEIQKQIFMPHGRNATLVIYTVHNRTTSKVKVRVFPLVSCRHFHSVIDKSKNPLAFSQKQGGSREVELEFANPSASLAVRTTNGEFHEKPNWIERLRYREEEVRGEASIDYGYQPGYFEIGIPAGNREDFAIVIAARINGTENGETSTTLESSMPEIDRLVRQEFQLRTDMLTKFRRSHTHVPTDNWLNWIILAANSFIVSGASNRKSVIAGYHWFEPWGRDSFISLPGLMLVAGKFDDAQNLLSNFRAHCKKGLIPNFLDDRTGKASYNTVDATLWFVNSVLQYLKYTGDFTFVRKELWETLQDIAENHMKGTDFDIHMDSDGLLTHGPRLTWMDSEFEGEAVTPRAGKAVEIQALWYNALRTVQLIAERFKEKNLADTYVSLADKVQASFNEKFWNSDRNCLFDVVSKDGSDASLRPNQALAIALDFTMPNREREEKILSIVERELLTPCGLRTLERNDPRYKGVYAGDRRSRDHAYHNGTAWPWLLGPFAKAFLKTKGCTNQNVQHVLENFIFPLFKQQVSQAGLGTINEIFDGDFPHNPRGCISQAWSVAEPLRAYIEDALQVKPKYEKELMTPRAK